MICRRGQFLMSPNCVFDASLVPGTCLERLFDLKGLINKVLESRITGHLEYQDVISRVSVNQDLTSRLATGSLTSALCC